VHQLCALFNGRRNISDAVAYVCPICLTEKRRCGSSGEQIIAGADTNRKMAAVDLPQTTLTKFLEERIQARLAIAYSETAEKTGVTLESVEKCPNLSLRLVSSYDKSHIVREGEMRSQRVYNAATNICYVPFYILNTHSNTNIHCVS
jgi:E1A/CREB-binding protein